MERHRQEDIRTMIQRHLLMHVYNPTQFFRGRTPLIPTSPYIPYGQLPAGMPGPGKIKLPDELNYTSYILFSWSSR